VQDFETYRWSPEDGWERSGWSWFKLVWDDGTVIRPEHLDRMARYYHGEAAAGRDVEAKWREFEAAPHATTERLTYERYERPARGAVAALA
jgi:hypothetical protein